MKDANTPTKESFWKKMVTIIGVGFVLIAAVYFGKKYKTSQKTAEITAFYNQFSDQNYIEFAKELEKLIHENKPEVFDESVDLASLFGFSNRELTKSYKKRTAIKTLEPYFKIGSIIHKQLEFVDDFKFTRFYKEDAVPHIVFRLYNQDHINFMDFTLGIKKGSIIITDIYTYYSGTLFSEMLSEMYYGAVNEEESFILNMKLYQQVNQLLKVENYKEAYQILTLVPVERKNGIYRKYLFDIASYFEDDTFLKITDDLKNLTPDDNKFHAYLKFLKVLISGNIDELNVTIEDLKKYVGDDVIFNLYKGLIYNSQSDFEQATSYFDLVIAQNSDFFDVYLYKLFNLLQQDKKEEALSLIRTMKKRFSIYEEDLTFDLQEFQDFTNLEAYKNIFKDGE